MVQQAERITSKLAAVPYLAYFVLRFSQFIAKLYTGKCFRLRFFKIKFSIDAVIYPDLPWPSFTVCMLPQIWINCDYWSAFGTDSKDGERIVVN